MNFGENEGYLVPILTTASEFQLLNLSRPRKELGAQGAPNGNAS